MEQDQRIMAELKAIRRDLSFLKKHVVDPDAVMTEDDKAALTEAEDDLKEGRATKVV